MIEAEKGTARLKPLLGAIGVASSSWYHSPATEPKRPGPAPRPLDEALKATVVEFARTYPWWGYKRLAIVLRRAGHMVSKKFVHAVFKAEDLMQKRRATAAELHQSAKLFELLPTRPNALWQSDVTYIHIPGHGWWYAVTVIDYYSRYLLACHLTPSYSAPEVSAAIDLAVQEAERLHGRLEQIPFWSPTMAAASLPGTSRRRSRTGSATSGPATARRSSSAYLSASTRRSSARRCTGSSTIIRKTPGRSWPPSGTATTRSARTGRWSRPKAATC